MKKLHITSLFILFAFIASNALSQVDMSGKWSATCIVEKTDEAKMTFCKFCQFSVSSDKSMITFEGFDLDFKDTYFNLIINEDTTSIQYSMDDRVDKLTFNYQNHKYEFSVLHVFASNLQNLILKDDDGLLIYLEKQDM